MGRLNRFIWFVIMIIIGGGVGLYYSWYVKPADFVDAALYNLRPDYKTDYVLMAAEIYDETKDRYHTFLQLDRILDQGEETANVVSTAIENAEGLGYDPVDLEKMRRLYEMVTGVRATATPIYDPTLVYSIEQNSTATAISRSDASPAATATPGALEADQDPFGTGITGIQITTDPNAVPMLDLPAAPTITPNYNFQYESSGSGSSSSSSLGDSDVFGGLPADFFGGD